MKHIVVIGAGETGVAELDTATERDRWDLAIEELTGWDGRGALFQALARIDGWAVVVPFSWKLVDTIDVVPGVLMFEYIDDARRPEERRPSATKEQLQLVGVR